MLSGFRAISIARWATLLIALMAVAPTAKSSTETHLTLKQCTPLPKPINMHGCTVARGRLFVIGGNDNKGYLETVYSAPIISPGELGTWREEESLPECRSYIQTSVECVNNRIYVIGGMNPVKNGKNSRTATRDILWTNVRADGLLEPWRRTPCGTETATVCGVTCSTDNAIFYIGGKNSKVSNVVYRCELARDGQPGPWLPVGATPEPRWFHAGALMNGRVYIWGGIPTRKNNPVIPDVYSAPVTSDKKLGPWRKESDLPSPFYSSASIGANNYLVSAGGRYVNAYPTNAIWYTSLEDGQPKKWNLVKSDLKAMVYHALALDRSSSTVYIVGGQNKKNRLPANDETLLNTVQAFQLPH